jgi:hypothetical protein
MGICRVSGCGREVGRKSGLGLCNAHYHRHRRGLPLDAKPVQNRGAGWLSTHGYRYLGKRGEHRRVMETILGRTLAYNEVVHHKDGDPLNNDPSNLEVIYRGDHGRHHNAGKTNEQRRAEKARLAGRP